MLTMESTDCETDGMDITNSKVIILWGEDVLLLRAVELLLNTKEGWKQIRFSEDWDDDTMIREVKRITPDVILVHEGTFVEKIHLLTKFVQDFPKLKIITINLENNLLEVYKKQTILIKEAADLISIIEDDVVADEQGGET